MLEVTVKVWGITYLLILAKFHEYLLPFFSNDLPETFGQNE